MTLLTTACLGLVAGVQLGGDHTCPSPAAVEAALARIDPNHETASLAPAEIARSVEEAGAAVVRFRSPGGGVLAERPLPVGLSCADRAEAAAVILVARLGRQPRQPVGPALLPPALPAPATAPPLAAQATAPPGPSFFRSIELEAAGLAALAGESYAPGVRAGVGLELAANRLVRLGLGHVNGQHADVGGGRATWSRWAAVLGYARRLPWDAEGLTSLGVGVDGILSAVRIEGTDFSNNERHTEFHPGLGGGVRIERRLPGRLRLWAGADIQVWLRRQTLYLRDGTATGNIPRFEILGSLGLAWSISAPENR